MTLSRGPSHPCADNRLRLVAPILGIAPQLRLHSAATTRRNTLCAFGGGFAPTPRGPANAAIAVKVSHLDFAGDEDCA